MKNSLEGCDSGLQFQQLLLLIHATGFDLIDACLDVVHLDFKERMLRIIEGEVGRGVEIDQAGNLQRKAAADRTQFLPGHGMPNQHGKVDLQRFHYRKYVITKVVR